ncbi:energy-coupling factor transporter ATPase [Aneurinibacillus thermoaerophilus]|uniref:ABC transporter ATP-binding protein n=1 Tax=Aneurinibacillus thermoaerophilus TaxID=143495 RepID=UPI002E240C2C|nr:energy-coupling factor transporter ATPase [Aneurinibacillus thermoaerophilus]MED0675968.1 energy-coupling factor transporter ATPase [Aneurinibacillus thermoaerophilus]
MTPHLACKDVSVRFFDSRFFTLKDVTLSIEKGEKVLFLGPSGCGKSTLLAALAGLIPGSIEAEITGEIVRPDRIGIMFQDPDAQFCMLTVGDEIAFSLENRCVPRNQMDSLIEKAMAQAGLSLPKDTPIATLSGGMKQRLALACLLALDADTLFFDEPTAQLDPQGRQEIFELLRSFSDSDVTMVFVEHVLDGLIDWMDRVVLFDAGGRLIGEGTPEDVLSLYGKEMEEAGIWKPRLFPHTMEEVCADPSHPLQTEWSSQLQRSKAKHTTSSLRTNEPVYTVHDLSISYGKKQVLTSINFSLHAGEWVAIVGKNGAGKSTLLKVLVGLEKWKQGDILFAGRSLKKWPTKALFEQVGFVFQNPELQFVTDRVYDEVAFGGKVRGWNETALHEKTIRLLQEFALEPFSEKHPFTLSQGQKRRLSVATMLLFDQKVLLLDEPTFGQDAGTCAQLLSRLQQRKEQGTSIIMVTHDMDLVDQYADRVLLLDNGTIQFDGTPYELFSSQLPLPGLIRPLPYEWERRIKDDARFGLVSYARESIR